MKQPMARVVSHEQIAHGIYELTLFTPIADIAEPGQFVHVKIPGGDATLLRRPISIARSEESTLTLIYQIKGKGTRLLSHVGAGDFLDVLGPLGNEFPTKSVHRALVAVSYTHLDVYKRQARLRCAGCFGQGHRGHV